MHAPNLSNTPRDFDNNVMNALALYYKMSRVAKKETRSHFIPSNSTHTGA